MRDAWLDFEDIKREWLEREVFAKPMLPLKHTINSYVEYHYVAAFLAPVARVEAAMKSTSASCHDLPFPHWLLADGYKHKHFLSLRIRRSAGLKLSGSDVYADATGKVVVERKKRNSGYVEESGIFISRPVLLAFGARMKLRLGFRVNSVRYTERELLEVGAVDKEFRPSHACFRMLRQDHHVVGGPRMQVRSIFWGMALA